LGDRIRTWQNIRKKYNYLNQNHIIGTLFKIKNSRQIPSKTKQYQSNIKSTPGTKHPALPVF